MFVIQRKYIYGASLVGIGTLFAVAGTYLPSLTPWVATGRVVVVVRAVPTDTDQLLGLGIDTMTLESERGSTPVSMRIRRALLDPKSDAGSTLLDTEARTGAYSGFSFELTSPEVRNSWQGDTPPEAVALDHTQVTLPAPYQVYEGETTVLILSFESTQALHHQDNRTVYLPVVQVETRHGGTVETTPDTNSARVEGGTILSSATYGMDWDGRMRHNFRTPTTAVTDVEIPTTPPPTPPVTEEETAPATASSTEEQEEHSNNEESDSDIVSSSTATQE
jgi:hypothetical protein